MPARTLVVQSHRDPLPHPWLEPCLDSVRGWAEAWAFDYRFIGDELFNELPEDLREKTATQPVVATDLARLRVLERALSDGYGCVVWCDADVLVFDPDRFELIEGSHALGREVWVQLDDGKLRAYVKVHNAFLMFRAGNPFLGFYRDAAERLVRCHEGPMVPQLVGPKLLTAIHNVVGCPVQENAGMLSPAVASELLDHPGQAFAAFRQRSVAAPSALNLCASLCADDARYSRLVERLLADPDLFVSEPA